MTDIPTAAETARRVHVALGDRAYDILIGSGLIDRAGELIRPFLRRDRVFIVTDQTVERLHGDRLQASLRTVGVKPDLYAIPPGESSKTLATLEAVLDHMIRAGAERDDLILAFGGGVVGDLTGLAAGLLKRGARFAQIPTTLLAQVDSSVGGKTAVNSPAGKNMIGLFNQPCLVLADLDVLSTLPPRELGAGLAEVVKYAFIDDPALCEKLEAAAPRLRAGDPAALAMAVEASCAAKARIVIADETEKGERALLNLGHTFGHALERANNYGPHLLHGEGVAAGMAMAFRYSVAQGLCPQADADRVERLLNALGLETRVGRLKGGPYIPADLASYMALDKKVKQGRLALILARGVGQSFIRPDADMTSVRDFLDAEVGLS
jgi:3-dehydroquinate synthase